MKKLAIAALKGWSFAVAVVGVGLLTEAIAAANSRSRDLAQADVVEEILPAAPSVLAAIREAPFSEVFTVTTATGETAYGVKDKDFNPAYELVGLYSLWGDIPERGLLQAVVMYCILDPSLEGTELAEITLMDGETALVTLNEKVVATETETLEVAPPQTVTTFADPFYSPYWRSGFHGFPGGTYITTYEPAVNCSLGGARFNLLPVQAELAQLPTTTLNVQLLFSDGQTETWRLGQSSVEAIKTLPSLQ